MWHNKICRPRKCASILEHYLDLHDKLDGFHFFNVFVATSKQWVGTIVYEQ